MYRDYNNIQNNPGLRALAKLMLNSFWGKFGQRSNMPQIKYISEPAEYFDMLTSDQILVMGMHSLLFVVVSDVPPFIVFALTPLWPTAGFLLHFEEGIHVIGKESSSFHFRIVLFRFIEMLTSKNEQQMVVYSV
jgi:hypothetical protein